MAMPGFRKLKRHRRKTRSKRSEVGAPPGELIADPDAQSSELSCFIKREAGFETRTRICVDALGQEKAAAPLIWVHCAGLADIAMIQSLGDIFGLHPLALEDVINTDQRPKCDAYENYIFLVMQLLGEESASEQISIFFGEGFVLSFSEGRTDPFEPVRRRIRRGGPRFEAGSADYLAYALIDAIVDAYFPLVDSQVERIETLETEIFDNVDAVQVPELHRMRRDMLQFRRFMRPTRDGLNALMRLERPWLKEETKVFFADVQDHCDQLIDLNDTYRDTASGLIDLHMTLSAARTNEVINLLTIISTIFIPLGFLAGLWGMNFNPEISDWNMPLTQSPLGYPVALFVMGAIALGLLAFFRTKRWI